MVVLTNFTVSFLQISRKMRQEVVANGRKYIYVTLEELQSVPQDQPIYVLQQPPIPQAVPIYPGYVMPYPGIPMVPMYYPYPQMQYTQPPPSIEVTPQPSTSKKPILALPPRAPSYVSLSFENFPFRPKITQKSTSNFIPKVSIEYRTVNHIEAPDYFVKDLHASTNEWTATTKMLNLESSFIQKVILRRKQARENAPSWKPLKRPELDHQETTFLTVERTKRSKRRVKVSKKKPEPEEMDIGVKLYSEEKPADKQQLASDLKQVRLEKEISHKVNHPLRLHPEIWHNESGELHDGPACSCVPKYRIGPLHNQFEGEVPIPRCNPRSNNSTKLYHYRIKISPMTNFHRKKPTQIIYQGDKFAFDGFSVFLHYEIKELPSSQLLRFNIMYNLFLTEEPFPPYFSVRSLDLLTRYLLEELYELVDVNWFPLGANADTSCPHVHLMPRFVRHVTSLDEDRNCVNVVEMLPINVVMQHWLREAQKPLIPPEDLARIKYFDNSEWSNYIAGLRGTLATFPTKKPAAIRIDQLDRKALDDSSSSTFPIIVHMTYTPMKLSLIREPGYRALIKQFYKHQYLMMNKNTVGSDGFFRTDIRGDVCLWMLNVVGLVAHVRFHKSLESLEVSMGYHFKNKSLLHQAFTHPSYRRSNFGTNQDHFYTTLVACGPQVLEYGNRNELYRSWRKKGLSTMIEVMSQLPSENEERSNIFGYERLEFLGDAVIEILTSIHLYYMFPDWQEGSLDAYRQAIVQNTHLAELGVRIGLHRFLLFTHCVDFQYESTFIYARSDAFEALFGAMYLDSDLNAVDRVFGAILFGDDPAIHKVWVNVPLHPLQAQFPAGDREFALKVPMFRKLIELEDKLGIKFNHIRLLARALTDKKTGYNFYTLGDNERLEFLGDSLLKYVATDYLFRHFPSHHEGHLSLLKNSLVNRHTQAAICEELGLDRYLIKKEDNSLRPSEKKEPIGKSSLNPDHNIKAEADLLEAFVGALFVDKDLSWVERFCQVCFWPRLVEFILKQVWNDAKSKLQQCCLTCRSLNEEPQTAHYRTLDQIGPTNRRVFHVGVYFRGEQLAVGTGRSVHLAQMDAANKALAAHAHRFKQLNFQKNVIKRKYDEPVVNELLDKVETYESTFVEQFIKSEKRTKISETTMEVKLTAHLKQNVSSASVKINDDEQDSSMEMDLDSSSLNEFAMDQLELTLKPDKKTQNPYSPEISGYLDTDDFLPPTPT
ncbi:hypothetical protein Ciccas_002339 [Cichlidogyrus casuarinus]|uniref:Uncharacterized protein n=1 Tax=Cichlidogyrus casuarinus TaxID=1844966 RepID=A0ABD2QHI7_9PLAT